MNKLVLLILGVIILVFGAISFINRMQKSPIEELTDFSKEDIHYHAGFLVYKDNELQDYSGLEYMHLKPCTEGDHEEELSVEEEQLEKAHLHDNVGDVVHVHRSGALWSDLFINIKVAIEPNTIAYVNGEKVDNFLNYPISEYNNLVVFEGENTDIEDKLASAVTKAHIQDVETKSDGCGS